MTDIIRTAANALKRTIDTDDFHNCGIIVTKEADADYDFFINSLTNYMNLLGNIREELKKEKLEQQGLIPNCSVHRCDFCKLPCKDRRQEGRICGCFTYPDKDKQLYVVK